MESDCCFQRIIQKSKQKLGRNTEYFYGDGDRAHKDRSIKCQSCRITQYYYTPLWGKGLMEGTLHSSLVNFGCIFYRNIENRKRPSGPSRLPFEIFVLLCFYVFYYVFIIFIFYICLFVCLF